MLKTSGEKKNVWTCWSSENNENKRARWTEPDRSVSLGAGPDGVEEIKRHAFFSTIDWNVSTHTHLPLISHRPTHTRTCNSPSFCWGFTPSKRLAWWLLAISLGHASYVCVCVCVSGQRASSHCVCTNSPVWVFKSQQDAIGRTEL